jgi:hypothetical protein
MGQAVSRKSVRRCSSVPLCGQAAKKLNPTGWDRRRLRRGTEFDGACQKNNLLRLSGEPVDQRRRSRAAHAAEGQRTGARLRKRPASCSGLPSPASRRPHERAWSTFPGACSVLSTGLTSTFRHAAPLATASRRDSPTRTMFRPEDRDPPLYHCHFGTGAGGARCGRCHLPRRSHPDTLFTAAVCEAEIRYGLARMPAGCRRDGLTARIDTFFEIGFRDQVLRFDRACAAFYGEIRHARESSVNRSPLRTP